MSSPYDQSLLASAPVATKAQMQGGYNPDLLNEKPVAPTPPASNSRQNLATPVPQLADGTYESQSPAKPPFYRTKKGILVIAFALVVVIAAAVGGGVGGSHKKKHTDTATDTGAGSNSTTSTGSIPGVGVGGSTASTAQGVGGDIVTAIPSPGHTQDLPGPITTESPSPGQMAEVGGGVSL